jgi:pyruvate,orthophosphate dikinase
MTKYVYTFGDKTAEGNKSMKILLGGKGANLAEMNLIGLPVPPGFTITTEACTHYYNKGREEILDQLKKQVEKGIKSVEKVTGKKFGDIKNPLLLSVRSGARVSMPGMMDTVLNLGLNDEVVAGFEKKTKNPRLAWDSYRRFIQMYGNVVMGMKPENKEDHDPFELIIDQLKEEKNIQLDTDFSNDDLKVMVERFKLKIKERLGRDVPQDPKEQIWGAIIAVFDSWMGARAVKYRELNDYPHDWGTAVNVQAMVFGNTGDESATGVAFTRDPANGEPYFTGEYLLNAQGEDVVAGIRTPQQITLRGSQNWAKLTGVSEKERKAKYPSLAEIRPRIAKELEEVKVILEEHYLDMQDLEFTVEEGKLWILQTRDGKRTGEAMVSIAVDMWKEGLIDAKTAIMRIEPLKLDELLHPVFSQEELAKAKVISQGLPASPGAASGQIVFFANDAEQWRDEGKQVILIRLETSPEDIKGMDSAVGILTARGGMTSHAAVVARGMGKCCVSGAGSIQIDYKKRTMTVGKKVWKEGEWISLNGTTGHIYEGKLATSEAKISGNFQQMMTMSDQIARLKVMANADTPKDASVARNFGARGIGLCRTEHMFFEGDRIKIVRKMILSNDQDERRQALDELLPIQRKDFEGIMESMHDMPVTIRLLDPPLHEFLPDDEEGMKILAKDLGITYEEVQDKVDKLHETNPMLGHRGCRLANTYPEISEMQTRAILEAAMNLQIRGINAQPEIMVPLTSVGRELQLQRDVIHNMAELIFTERGKRFDYKIGTMIEIPRAALCAAGLAKKVDFFSFGTNDLTQMTYGYSRDDINKFLPIYLEKGILQRDPFTSIDPYGVGQLVAMGTANGKKANPKLKVGICGEHGGDPASIEFFNKSGLDYVSCSPYRVPIARLVSAQAVIKQEEVKEPELVS